jgi:hypothetical protein
MSKTKVDLHWSANIMLCRMHPTGLFVWIYSSSHIHFDIWNRKSVNLKSTRNTTLFFFVVHAALHQRNMDAFFSFDLFMAYIPECKKQLRTMK